MKDILRYAVYFAPEEGSDWAEFGASWLGWDAAKGQACPHPVYPACADLPIAELTKTPRKYGFHGTLKPPFKLAEGQNVEDVHAALQHLAQHSKGFDIPAITLRSIGGFLAVVPAAPSPELAELASHCVKDLDHLRAPASPQELDRRRAAKLSAAQDRNLIRWGYPYVFDEFRFHLTLTGRLEPAMAERALTCLGGALAPLLNAPLPVRELCLFGEDSDGRFHILKRFQLTG